MVREQLTLVEPGPCIACLPPTANASSCNADLTLISKETRKKLEQRKYETFFHPLLHGNGCHLLPLVPLPPLPLAAAVPVL